MRLCRLQLLLIVLLYCSGCTFSIITYPLAPMIAPVIGSSNSISVPSYSDVIGGKEGLLKNLTIAVLKNPYRAGWRSLVDQEQVDKRLDENQLLAEFLENTGLFRKVILVDSPQTTGVDYVISCSVDCIYTIELNAPVYIINCITLGIGFLLGVPYEESSAFYIAEAVVMESRKEETPRIVSGTLAENYKVWLYDNMYWRPDFYGYSALKPLFAQILYDFLTRSGCLQQ